MLPSNKLFLLHSFKVLGLFNTHLTRASSVMLKYKSWLGFCTSRTASLIPWSWHFSSEYPLRKGCVDALNNGGTYYVHERQGPRTWFDKTRRRHAYLEQLEAKGIGTISIFESTCSAGVLTIVGPPYHRNHPMRTYRDVFVTLCTLRVRIIR